MADFGLLAGGAKTQRYNIPIEHLDFKYVSECKDVRELEKIYRLLKSGEEGSYPDLTEHVAQRLKQLAPKSRALRKNEPMLRPSDLDSEEQKNLSSDLEHWKSSMREWQTEAVGSGGDVITAEEAPPPRKTKNLLLSSAGNRTETVRPDAPSSFSGSKLKRAMPRTPDEWTRLEKQLEEQEEAEAAKEKAEAAKEKAKEAAAAAAAAPVAPKKDPLPFKSKVPPALKLDPLTPRSERQRIADDEKDKGNEAFRSGDYQEALVYYCRSLSVLPLASVRNNRALTYIKLKKWSEAIQDCNKVLKEEPKNVKALLRRATCLTEEHRLSEARRDTEAVLQLVPDDSRAKKLLSDIAAEEAQRSQRQEKGSRRLQIEENSSEEEEEEEEEKEEEDDRKLKEGERRLTIEECEEEEEEEEDEEDDRKLKEGERRLNMKECEEEEEKVKEEVSIAAQATPARSASPAVVASKGDIWTEEDLDKAKDEPLPKMPAYRPTRPPPPPPPPPPPTKEEQFLEMKEQGNCFMRQSQFRDALRCYDQCLQLCPGNVIGHNNRALVHIRLENFNDAIYDCNMVLEKEPHNVKALFRRGLARKYLGDFPESLVDFRAAMMFEPANESITAEIEEVQSLLKETGGRRRMRIQEIEEEEEEDEENEEQEEKASGDGEEIPVIREAWPEGLARDWTEKAKEEMEKARLEVEKEKKRLESEAERLREGLAKEKAVEQEMRHVTAQIEREQAELEALVRANEGKSGRKPLIEEMSPPSSEAEQEEREGEERRKGEKKELQVEVQEEKPSVGEAVGPKEVDRLSGSREEEDAESGGSWVEVEEHMLHEDVAAASSSIYPTARPGDNDPLTPTRLMTVLFASQPCARRIGAMLLHLPPESLPQFMTTQLDRKALTCLISALHDEVLPRQKFELVYRFLVAIRDVKRFSIVRMFLDQSAVRDLSDLFQVLEDVQASGHLPNVQPENLSSLRASYINRT